ncbi:RHS repeat domain-containing protein, partial [Psychromonas antarctica]|uniref:RHS repeat domain-containing protein n=1 Tax=Psychromonas antarctica TaxID=67573 RepID=UPI001EE823B4
DEATYQIQYSATEKPTKLIGFDGREQTFQYDVLDKLVAVNDGDSRFITLKRDNRGRIIDQHSVKSPNDGDGAFNSHNFYQYDKIGRVILAHNSDRVIQQQYHLNGQISQSKQGDWLFDYTFNEQGKRSGLTLPDGKKIGYLYNELGLLNSLTLVQPDKNETALLALEYSAAGQVTQQTLGNGITLQQDYDVRSRLTTQDWSGQQGYHQQRRYQYDKKNQLISSTEQTQGKVKDDDHTHNKPSQRRFSYNKLSQLVSSECKTQTEAHSTQSKDTTERFDWDAFGNPLVDKSKAKKDQETRVEKDRLLSFAGSDYRYDSSGNQIASTATGLIQKRSFDGLNQLRQLNSNGTLSQYQYDALGRRSAKITESGKTDFIWDGNQLIGEHTNGQYSWYIYLPDSFLPVALIKGDEIYYYHLDQLGTPICLTDSHEQVVWQNNGDLFGAEGESKENSLEPIKVNKIENPLRFQGQYFDAESGLHYNRFRYYCPKQGRFIHQDPIGLAGGINPYQYAPNPVNWVDPFGLSCKEGAATAGALALARPLPVQSVTNLATSNITRVTVQAAANDAAYLAEESMFARVAPMLGTVAGTIALLVYSPSLGGELEQVAAADGTTYSKYSDEMIYSAVGADGETWSTSNPQQDMQYRMWKADGGEGTLEDWLSQGKPDVGGIPNVAPNNSSNATVPEQVPMSQAEYDRIINLEQKKRPEDVTEYLDADYVANHLAKFENEGGAFIQVEAWLDNPEYPSYQSKGKFVGLKSEMDLVIAKYKASGNDWKVLRDELNLGENEDFSNTRIVYVKLPPKDPRFNYEMPTGNENGAYEGEWVPGGYTKNGTAEATLTGGDNIVHDNNVDNIVELLDGNAELLQ